jgi:hypothetical protein
MCRIYFRKLTKIIFYAKKIPERLKRWIEAGFTRFLQLVTRHFYPIFAILFAEGLKT